MKYFYAMPKNSVLWKLEHGNCPNSYLFGTMHVRDKVAFSHFERVVNKMALCEQLMCEIDLDRAQQVIPISAYQIPDGKLSDFVSEKRFLKMEKIVKKSFGIELKALEQFYPIMIINKLTESVMTNDKTYPLDVIVWKKAQELKLRTDGLETIEEHLAVLAQLDVEMQVKMMKDLLRYPKKFRKSIKKISKIYEAEDIKTLYKLTKKSLGSFRKIMIYDRNQLMADRIFENRNTSCMYAVGAAHLSGNKGILKYLKQKSYKIKPV